MTARQHRRPLLMLWPEHLLDSPPVVQLADGYRLTTFVEGDREAFFDIQLSVGWGMKEGEWRALMEAALPDGIFFIERETTDERVATAAALHNPDGGHWFFPGGGELAWVAVAPSGRGQGLGWAVSAAATTRLIAAGYRSIRLVTYDDLLPAIKLYLKMGYRPFLYAEGMESRWRAACEQVGWPVVIDDWIESTGEHGNVM